MKPDGVRITVTIEGVNSGGIVVGRSATKTVGFFYDRGEDRAASEKRVGNWAKTRAVEAYRDLVFYNRWLSEDDPMNAHYEKVPV